MDDNLAPDCDMDCTLDRPMAGRSLQCHPSVIWQQRQDDKSSGADDRHGQGGEGGEERGGEWKKEAAAGFSPLEGLSKRPRGSTSVLQLVHRATAVLLDIGLTMYTDSAQPPQCTTTVLQRL